MKRVPPLPDLARLSGAQKDELIVSLWQTLLAMEGATEGPAMLDTAPSRDLADLRLRIGRTAASRRAWVPRRSPGIVDSWLLLGVMLAIGIGFLGDVAVGWYQQRLLEARGRAALELETAAFNGLYVELPRIEHDPDGRSYRAVLNMHNSTEDKPLYVMLSPVRSFVQVGLSWREVQAHPPAADAGMVKLTADHEYQALFRTDVKDWTELIPGYMHVRIESDMLISRRAEPGDDIVERNNRFYVYLKPQGADDAAIRRRSNFPGTPPVFIPMPPH